MIRRYWPIVLPLLLAAAGCQTSAEAVSTVNAAWVGRPADDFFSRYGAPYASFPRQDGGAIYSWRGGEQTLAVNTAPRPPAFPPSPFGTAPAVQPASAPLFGDTKSRTTSNSWVRADGTKVTETRSRTTSASVNVDTTKLIGSLLGAAAGASAAPKPATRTIVCELSITADPQGVITALSVKRDTEGAFLSLSRCGDILK